MSRSPAASIRALLATWRGRFIVAFLLLQMLLPLRYYVAQHDPHDERFAWRMFSPMRMTKCRIGFTIDKVPVELGSTFHEAWLEIAQRGRSMVIDAMAAKLCTANPGKPVEATLECSYIDRPPGTYGGFDLCTRPLL